MSVESEEISQLRAGFEQYYQNNLLTRFAGMEAVRKKYLRFFIIAMITTFVIIPGIMIGLFLTFLSQNGGNFHYESQGDFPLGLIFFGILVLITIVSTPIVIYKRKSKSQVMPEFIKYFGDFHYEYQSYIDDTILNMSKLFKDYNCHSGDDFFDGKYKDVQMIISEENLVYQTTDSKGRSRNSQVFKGIVIMLEMNKNFKGQTIVLKDWGIFNSFHKLGVWGNRMQKITLEDSIFEKEFEVYGSDQLEARYLLTTAFMERMLKVRDAYKTNKIQFSFFDNKLLIAIKTNQNMFESTSIFRSCTDRKMIDETFEQFVSVMAIIDILKLDKRLGM